MDNKAKITWIAPEDIAPHPDNPRKDLGDLEELTESIKAVGIMQNLAVISREDALHALETEQENGNDAHGLAKTKNELQLLDEEYVVLLGHRRLAAAKEADLEKVPCIVMKGLSLNDQISLMLVENIQRNNLTVTEQAQSFQMMLDLGDTVKTVAEKTGFLQSTVRHRVEIAKLDPELVEEHTSGSYQLSITDLIALEEIEDVGMRNQILENSEDSDDLANGIREYIEECNIMEAEEKVRQAVLNETGITLKDAPKNYSTWSDGFETVFKKDAKNGIQMDSELMDAARKVTKGCFLYKKWGDIIIARKTEKKPERRKTEAEIKLEEQRKKTKELEELTGKMIDEWKRYIREILAGIRKQPKDPRDFPERIYRIAARGGVTVENHTLAADMQGKNEWNVTDEEIESLKIDKMPVIPRFLYNVATSARHCRMNDWNGYYQPDELIQETYDLLTDYGYRETNEDYIHIMDGTHEMYAKKK